MSLKAIFQEPFFFQAGLVAKENLEKNSLDLQNYEESIKLLFKKKSCALHRIAKVV